MGSRSRLFHAVHALHLFVRLFALFIPQNRFVVRMFLAGLSALHASLAAQPSVGMAAKPHAAKKAVSSQEAFIEVIRSGDQAGEILIAGRATNRLPSEMTQVQLAFQSESSVVSIPLPLQRVARDSATPARYEFETLVCGLPQIAPHDPRHAKPFFAILIADRNGNRYYQEESYAQFISPGEKAVPLERVIELPPQSLFTRVLATPSATARIAARTPQAAFELKAVRQGTYACRLEWPSLPATTAATNTPSIILRDGQHAAITFANYWVDRQISAKPTVKYRVEQSGKDGIKYSSNTVEIASGHAAERSNRIAGDSGGLIAAGAYVERTPEALAAVVSKHNAAIQHCFQRELKHNSALRGEVRVRIVVNARGSVDSVNVISSTLKSPTVEDCMVSRIKRWNDFGPSDPRKAGVAIKQTYVFGY